MDEHMGRRTVGGLLFTKGGSILLFREDSSRPKPGRSQSHGCNGARHSADKGRPTHSHREAAAATPTPRRSQPLRKPPQGSSNAASSCGESGNDATREATAPAAGRDLLARLKDRVSASRKRSLAREMSSPSSSSSSGGFSGASSSSGAAVTRSPLVSRPSHRAASRVRKGDGGENAGGGGSVRRDNAARGGGGARRNSDDAVMAEQAVASGEHHAPGEGFISGFLARYRSSLQGGRSPSDGAEDSGGYWRFDVEGSEELENYFMRSDRHRAMRMDIDDMSYEELLALGDRIGTVNTGLSEDALHKCLKRSLYVATAPETHQDCDRKCSICQEEYSGGEEVGKMACKHYYHIVCIQHWLRQKNWCPICKSVASKTN